MLLVAAGPDDLEGSLRAVAAQYYAGAGTVAVVAGPDTTMDYYDRLVADAALLHQAPPAGYPPDACARRFEPSRSSISASPNSCWRARIARWRRFAASAKRSCVRRKTAPCSRSPSTCRAAIHRRTRCSAGLPARTRSGRIASARIVVRSRSRGAHRYDRRRALRPRELRLRRRRERRLRRARCRAARLFH